MPLSIIGFRTYYSTEASVEREVFLQLEAVAGYKRIIIENWLSERLDDLTAALHSTLITEGDPSRGSPALFSNIASDQFEAFALITHHGTLLNPGHSIEDSIWATTLMSMLTPGWEQGRSFTLYGPTEYDPRIGTWFTLLQSYSLLDGRVYIAAGKVKISSSLDKLLHDSIGLGESGQSYLVDSAGVMLTGSRFHQHPAPGTHKMSSPAIDSALAGRSGVGLYYDWKGNRTLGAWTAVGGSRWALIAEMDEREALRSVRRLRNEWLIIVLLAFILSGFAATVLSRSLSRPILDLASISRSVAAGNLKIRSNLRLNDELGELSSSFNSMIAALDESRNALKMSYERLIDKEKRLVQSEKLAAIGELVASVVHELRNPLSTVKMNLNILAKAFPTSNAQSEQFAIALEQTARMEQMLGTLLEFSKPVQPNLEKFSLTGLLANIVNSNEFGMEQAKIELQFDSPDGSIDIIGDKELLTQAFSNIIRNGIEALQSSQDGKIQVFLKKSDGSPGDILVTVKDNGAGMSPATLERIFEPFFTTRGDGTGLGLPNVKKVIDLHRGAINISSEKERGTTVEITLPRGEYLA